MISLGSVHCGSAIPGQVAVSCIRKQLENQRNNLVSSFLPWFLPQFLLPGWLASVPDHNRGVNQSSLFQLAVAFGYGACRSNREQMQKPTRKRKSPPQKNSKTPVLFGKFDVLTTAVWVFFRQTLRFLSAIILS